MEYAGGQNLDIYLTRKTLSLDVLRSYTEELLDALEFLHNKAVVHKNLRVSWNTSYTKVKQWSIHE